MPYIPEKERKDLEDGFYGPEDAGELNYKITTLLLEYLPCTVDGVSSARYQDYNEIIGVLECVKQEFYRRMMVPYEDKKIEENGDVY